MQKYEEIIAAAVKDLSNVDAEVKLTRPDPKFGDYATNVALAIAGKVGQNPREIAEKISEELREKPEFESVEIAGPGFINLTISAKHLAGQLENLNQEIQPDSGEFAGQTIVTEYSDPNPFKELHVGHLYTTVVGESVSRLAEAAGGTVHRVNFGGDVGLHVAKAMWGILQSLGGENPEKLNEITKEGRANFLSQNYVKGSTAYDDSETAKQEIIGLNKRIYEIHAQDDHASNLAKIYWTCRQWSYDYFDDFYREIGVKFEKYYPESEGAEIGLETVRAEEKRGVYEESNGAVVFRGEKFGMHTRVFINSEGLPTYETKDLGTNLLKWRDYHFDKSIIITGNDIIEYMKVMLKSVEQFNPDLARRTLHITHGNVKLAGVSKMSSRKGNVLRAVDVIDMVKQEYLAQYERVDMMQILGAIKYAFLKNNISGDTIFDAKESVSMVGNSGPYVQYAAVRVNKILRDNGMMQNPDNLRVEKRTCVGAFILSSDDKVLLGHNRKGGAYSGQLIVPGGGIDEGETPEQAVIRETLEEVGVDAGEAKIVRIDGGVGGTEKILRGTGEKIWADMEFVNFAIYFDKPAAEIVISDADDDFGEAKWFTREELLAQNINAPTTKNLQLLGWLPEPDYDYAPEKTLILKLLEYPETLRAAAHEFEPHRIATYVYELARELNRYYETTPVATKDVPDDVKAARLQLLQKISQVFTHGLGILGIEIPEKM